MELNEIKEALQQYLKEQGLTLYSCNYTKNDRVFSVILDEKLDLDELEEISNGISAFMDSHDGDLPAYFLDVSTVGAERPIRNAEEIKEAVGSYVYVRTKEISQYGTLLGYEEGTLLLEYTDKTRKKKLNVNEAELLEMRYAVKL